QRGGAFEKRQPHPAQIIPPLPGGGERTKVRDRSDVSKQPSPLPSPFKRERRHVVAARHRCDEFPRCMSDSRPIGVFDSGIGGLTVVRALHELLPNENIFYLGDTARVPYGNKSAETVERYGLELARILMAEDAKLIVVACNTVSSVAIPKLRVGVSVPVIGVIEPGAHAAIAMTRNRHVGVIGTRATIRSGAYENALRALNVHV